MAAATLIKFPPDAPFDDDYLVRFRNGDSETAQHFNAYFRRLLGITLCGAFSQQRINDLIDEVMFVVTTNIMRGQPRDAGKLVHYVRGVCSNLKNRAIQQVYKNAQEDVDLERILGRGESAAERLLREENERKVKDVLRELSERDRNILNDLFYNELTREEVCEKHAPLTRDQLKVILFHALRRFKKHLERKNEEQYGQQG